MDSQELLQITKQLVVILENLARDMGRLGDIIEKQIDLPMEKGLDVVHVYKITDTSYERITQEQLEYLEHVISTSGYNDMVIQLLSYEHVETLACLPKSRYFDSLKRISELIALRKGIKQ